MRKAIKYLVGKTYRPLLRKYLSKTRVYKYGDLRLEIPAEVFHPGFFFSTRLLLTYISQLPLQGKKFLELGAGSGLISLFAAKKNASVIASDINPVAIDYLNKNAQRNNVVFSIQLSDLFTNIPETRFDIIAINPPYYKKQPETMAQHAWYCGENGEYFSHLFAQIGNYMHEGTNVLMVLSDECDMTMITRIASAHGFAMQKKITHKLIWEYLYIYQITRS